MKTLKIAFRNLNRQKKRSSFLVIALAFAFFVVISIDGLFAGALNNMSLQISKLVGGHVYIVGAKKAADQDEDDDAQFILDKQAQQTIQEIATKLNVDSIYTIKRTNFHGKIIFDSKEGNLKVDGCNFADEPLLKESLHFIKGSWDSLQTENAIIISEQTANYLQVDIKDTVLFETQTINNQNTLAEFEVAGIFSQKSALGALSAYANIDYVNKIYGASSDNIIMYSIFLKDNKQQDKVAEQFEQELQKIAKTTNRKLAHEVNPQNPSSNLMKQVNEGKWQGTKYMIATFYDFVPQLATLLSTLTQISLGVLFVLLLITMIGVSNTFKIMIQERRSEIGSMRACGASKFMIKRLFIDEALLLALIGAVIGTILAVIFMQVISYIPLSSTSDFYVFTKNGFLSWQLLPLGYLIKLALILILTFISVFASAVRAANMIPAEALRSGK